MFIQLQPQHLTILELELILFVIKVWIVLVDDAVVIGTDDNDVGGVVVLRLREVVDMMSFHNTVAIFVTDLLATNLIAIVIELLEHTDDLCQCSARVDDILNDDHMIAADILCEVIGDLDLSYRGGAGEIASCRHKAHLTGDSDLAAEVGEKNEGALQHADQQQRLALVLPAKLPAALFQRIFYLLLGDKHTVNTALVILFTGNGHDKTSHKMKLNAII